MWTGRRISGQPSSTGSSGRPAIGTCTASSNAIALRRLSKMRRPSRTARTIEVKSSSSSTSAAASRATSVPRPPMAMPMSAALSAGASFTPSPVMATISPLALSAAHEAQLLLGAHPREDAACADVRPQRGVVQRCRARAR